MKKIMILFLISLPLLFSCDKVDEALTFDIEHSTTVTVQGSVIPFDPPAGMPTPDVTTNSEQKFENNNTSKDKVKDIILKEAELEIQDPPSTTFSFLKEIYVYISTNSVNEIRVAWKTDIPKDVQTINLETTSESLDAYVKSDEYSVRTEVVTREVISQDVEIDMDLIFQVTADPL